MSLEVIGLDHLYLSVSDFERSEQFYDAVMETLGFRKGDLRIANAAHAHYFNRVLQLSIRPAQHPGARHDSQAPGLHHLCFQLADDAAVDEAHRALVALGVDATSPRLYPEYAPDYYASFFQDPDGIRLEVRSRGRFRRDLVAHWNELRDFRNPFAEMAARKAIRTARPEDLPQLAAIERAAAELFRDVGLADLFGSVLTASEDLADACAEGRLFLATDPQDRPVGFALASEVDGHGHLDELDVHPDQGRRGLGRALVERVLTWARDRGYRAVTLTTLRNVAWNAPFYERLGFRVLAEGERGPVLEALLRDEIARGLPAEHRVVMRCDLRASRGIDPA